MSYRTTTTTTWTKEHTLNTGLTINLVLNFQPSSIMDFKDYIIREDAGKITLGYLADDTDPQNPMEDDDYFGSIFTAHRHSRNLDEYYEALGLYDGSPALDLIKDDWIVQEVHDRLLDGQQAKANRTGDWLAALDYCEENFEKGEGDDDLMVFVTGCLDDLDSIEESGIFDLDDIRLDIWKDKRDKGEVGNPYAILLDVFEHSMVKYSVSGTGPQCLWDTALGGAVWIPSELSVEDIEAKGKTYEERYAAAVKMAESAAEAWTNYCNGNAYLTVVEEYVIPEDLEEGQELETEDHRSCGGYLGSDSAFEALKQEFD